MRIAFVGAGTVAGLHAAAIQRTAGVELAGVYDSDRAAAGRLADRAGTAVIDDLASLCADRAIDAVYILTPTQTHAQIAAACLESGKHVLIEKPVSPTPASILALAERARRCGLVAAPAHNYVYLPECARLIRQARSGSLGDVRALFVTYAIKHPEELAARYGGVLDEVMVHHASIALAVLGPPDRCAGGVSKPAWQRLSTEDQAWMTWEYRSGASVHLFASFAVDDMSSEPLTFTVKALGTGGSSGFSWRSSTTTGGPFTVGMPLYEETYDHEAAAFRDAVVNGSPLLSTLDDAAAAAQILIDVRGGPQ